jgi:hypothetical protein
MAWYLIRESKLNITFTCERAMGQEDIRHIDTEQSAAGLSGGNFPAPAKNKTPYILVVTRNGNMAEPVMDYALNVAERLKYSVLAAYINTLPFYRDGGKRSKLFASTMQESSKLFREKGEARSIPVEHTGATGKIGKIVNQLCHTEKRVEFVVIDQGINVKEVSSQSPVPVFSVIYTQAKAGRISKTTHNRTSNEGVSRMSTTTSRKRHIKNCFIFGALTAGVYAAVFTHQEFVMKYFTKGGFYALLPVAVVFAISYAHGNFTSSFWSALGIEGSKASSTKKADIRKETPASVDIRKDTRPRAQVNA